MFEVRLIRTFEVSLYLLILISVTLTLPSPSVAEQLSWTAPTTNVDNSPLIDLASFRIKRSTVSGNYTNAVITTVDAGTTTAPVPSLQLGAKYYFVVTAVDSSGNESVVSNEVSYQVTSLVPPAPTPDAGSPSPTPPPSLTPEPRTSPDPTGDNDGDGIINSEDLCPFISDPNATSADCAAATRVAFDFDGDRSTDAVAFTRSGYKIVTGLNLEPQNSIVYRGKVTAQRLGSGSIAVNSADSIITVTPGKRKNTLLWTAINQLDGTRTTVGSFGKVGTIPVIGCHHEGQLVPAFVESTNGGKAKFNYRFRGKVRGFKLPASNLVCSAGDGITSNLVSTGIKPRRVRVLRLTGGKALFDMAVPTELTKFSLAVIPAFGAIKEQYALHGKTKDKRQKLFIGAAGSQAWTEITLPPYLSNATLTFSGVFNGQYRWLMFTDRGKKYILPLETAAGGAWEVKRY